MSTTLICCNPAYVGALWPAVLPLLEKGYEATDELTPPDLMERIARDEWRLWLAVDAERNILAAMTTRVRLMRSGRALQLLCCGGDHFALWNHHMAEIEAYARAEGCAKITAEGRKGWLRLLNGFKSDSVIFEKALFDGQERPANAADAAEPSQRALGTGAAAPQANT